MDFTRTTNPARQKRHFLLAVAAVLIVVTVSVVAARLKPAAPVVERSTVWMGTVERGPMLRQVRGHGTLQPEAMRWIPAPTTGTVDTIHVEPGDRVTAGDVLLELGNVEVEQMAVDAESSLRRAHAEYESLRLALANQNLSSRAEAAAVEAEYVQATLDAESDRELAEKGLVSDIQVKRSRALAEAMTVRREIARERVPMASAAAAAQLEAKQAEVEQQEALATLRVAQREALLVRAGLDGVVQEIPAEIGQQVAPGTNLARVAELSRLKAELQVPANQTRDLRPGLPVVVDTRDGTIDGTLVRIDPAVRQGTVTVDVRLDGELPPGARPDLAVDGAIEIERLANVLLVGRAVHADEHRNQEIFRLEEDGSHVSKVEVSFGRASVDTIEVLGGLAEGDQIVLSDTTRWDKYQRVQLK